MLKNAFLIFLILISFVLTSCTKKDTSLENGTSSSNTGSTEKSGKTYKVGDVIEDFTLKGADGGSYSLNGFKDAKAKVIVFWSTECPVVKAYNDRVVALNNEYESKGAVFLPMYANTTESEEDVKEHVNENGYKFKALIDEGHKIADRFGATRTPEVFVIDSSGKLVYHGRVDDSQDESKVDKKDLRAALDEVLAGKEVTVKETKSFGCTIKR